MIDSQGFFNPAGFHKIKISQVFLEIDILRLKLNGLFIVFQSLFFITVIVVMNTEIVMSKGKFRIRSHKILQQVYGLTGTIFNLLHGVRHHYQASQVVPDIAFQEVPSQ